MVFGLKCPFVFGTSALDLQASELDASSANLSSVKAHCFCPAVWAPWVYHGCASVDAHAMEERGRVSVQALYQRHGRGPIV